MDETNGGGSPFDISDDDSDKSPPVDKNAIQEIMETLDESIDQFANENALAIPESSRPQPPCPPTPVPAIPLKTSATPRHKAYPEDSKGPWVVFFRPKQKPLNIPRISKDLTTHFSAVTDILKVTPNKLRVTVDDRKQANRIVTCERFSIEYRVYIPSHAVEIEGVVTEESLTCADFLHAESFGMFKNRALPKVKILDCFQLPTVSFVGTKKIYSQSNSFRVTFSGSALPDYVAIGKVRLPVRLFVPKVMNCTNCKQLGHTAAYCSNKHRCDICGEKHAEGPCEAPLKCVYCKDTPHDLSECPKYKQQGEKLKRSLVARSKRTLAEIVKSTASSSQPIPNSNNRFSLLPVDDQGSDTEVGEGSLYVFKGNTRKRAKINTSEQPANASRTDSQATLTNSRGGGNVPKPTPPGFRPCNFNIQFPSLPGSSKTPDIPVLRPEKQRKNQQEHVGMFKFSEIVEGIFSTFNLSDSTRNIINLVLPIVKTFLKQLASRWSFIASIISFDG